MGSVTAASYPSKKSLIILVNFKKPASIEQQTKLTVWPCCLYRLMQPRLWFMSVLCWRRYEFLNVQSHNKADHKK